MEENNTIPKKYIAIDLKSFYASVECMERMLDPLTTNLVVADVTRTEKTICLAVSPSLKAYGIPGRARLFEVQQKVEQVNRKRLAEAPGHVFTGESDNSVRLNENKNLRLSYIAAPPRMAHYMDYSTRIYQIYLKYVAAEDIHVYSIDEVIMDVSQYLRNYHMTAKELAKVIIEDVFSQTGITATAGIGTNMYLAKIAMDIVAKHVEADENGVRIAELNERAYRLKLWDHRPLTDFWRVGRGYARKLEANGLFTMGDIARCSIGKENDYYNEDFLYKLFGINAELLIDHAWGYEPCTIAQVKAYKPQEKSICQGQVLKEPYTFEKTRLIVREMTDLLALDLTEKNVVTDQLVLTVGYDVENILDPERRKRYKGEVKVDGYGRLIPKHAHGTINLPRKTYSSRILLEYATTLFERICDPNLLVRRINITANHILSESDAMKKEEGRQMDLFTDFGLGDEKDKIEEEKISKEKNLQKALLSIQHRYGKNAVVRGMNLEEGATTIERNGQIGGHKA